MIGHTATGEPIYDKPPANVQQPVQQVVQQRARPLGISEMVATGYMPSSGIPTQVFNNRNQNMYYGNQNMMAKQPMQSNMFNNQMYPNQGYSYPNTNNFGHTNYNSVLPSQYKKDKFGNIVDEHGNIIQTYNQVMG